MTERLQAIIDRAQRRASDPRFYAIVDRMVAAGMNRGDAVLPAVREYDATYPHAPSAGASATERPATVETPVALVVRAQATLF